MNPGPVLIGISGTSLSARCREHLSHQAVGGVVLFSRNFEDRAQLERLVWSAISGTAAIRGR
jgi:beta-N-acetylhexosaminidase